MPNLDQNTQFTPANSNYTRAQIAADLNLYIPSWSDHVGCPLAANDERLTDDVCQAFVDGMAELGQTLGEDEYNDHRIDIWSLI